MKIFKDYRSIKNKKGLITEQEFITDKGPENLEIEIVDSGDKTVVPPTTIPLKQISPEENNTEEKNSEETVTPDSLITKIVNFQLQLRILHWNTLEYPQHIASGDTYKNLDDLIDTLVETYQGYNNRVKFCDCINIRNIEDLIIDEWIECGQTSIKSLREMVIQTDLQNILDEIAGSIGKLKYLLTLK